jgi:hypothetical protein
MPMATESHHTEEVGMKQMATEQINKLKSHFHHKKGN